MILAGATPEIVTDTLSGMGLAGAVITVLMAVVTSLAGAIIVMFRINNKLHAERKAENALVIKVIENVNNSLTKLADSTDDRNVVTEALADAIKVQAATFELVNQRIEFYHNGNIEKLGGIDKVVAAMSEAVRVSNGTVSLIRDGVGTIASNISDMKAKIDNLVVSVNAVMARRGR